MEQTLKKTKDIDSNHIRMARSGLNITVRELAVLTDLNKATIVRAEAGLSIRDRSLDTIREALETLGATFFEDESSGGIFVGIR